ncbi:NEDD8 ultimate buster 1 [Olea europaea subsp. europaea]|uniref:NEDD8 ultimate buster 1 n=1 Tax=Olea europaea subsp. europaea TaxID=158383 RepID=A0A8S0UY65_OLEEU|nr:NEDD8 ultimate buster 1 [Olea europaea subsp. europaea]
MGMGKLRIVGAWSGVLEVELDEWTVATLREEVVKKSGLVGPQCINLISAGRVLRDGYGTEKLSQLGVKNNAKILASKVSTDQERKSLKEEFLAEEERSKRLSRLKGNNDGTHANANAKALIKRQQYKDALEVLTMGEEAFSLCNHKVIEMVDNVSILQIDMVWCYFMLHDISWLSVAGIRLAKTREGIEHAHGKESSRMRALQGGRYLELAPYLRLQLLEGVIAYHNGQLQKSKEALTAAQAKYTQLQVTDETLSLLMSMGYKARDAKRALRMSNQDVGSAVDFLVEEKAKKERELEEDH